jgi:hypothetical protein
VTTLALKPFLPGDIIRLIGEQNTTGVVLQLRQIRDLYHETFGGTPFIAATILWSDAGCSRELKHVRELMNMRDILPVPISIIEHIK